MVNLRNSDTNTHHAERRADPILPYKKTVTGFRYPRDPEHVESEN
jgi:hypothetical protein